MIPGMIRLIILSNNDVCPLLGNITRQPGLVLHSAANFQQRNIGLGDEARLVLQSALGALIFGARCKDCRAVGRWRKPLWHQTLARSIFNAFWIWRYKSRVPVLNWDQINLVNGYVGVGRQGSNKHPRLLSREVEDSDTAVWVSDNLATYLAVRTVVDVGFSGGTYVIV